jgi:hypothetical protein
MKNISVPDDYRKIAESDRMMVYEVKTDDRFIEFICKKYNIKLCLCVDKKHINGHYMCMFYYDGLDVDDFIHYPTFCHRVVIFKDKNNQVVTPYVYFLKIYESFRLNIFECINSFKSQVVDAISRGINILTICCSAYADFGTIPRGSSEKEILMKMELMGN